MNYAQKVDDISNFLSYRDIEKYVFKKNMHGSYTIRTMHGTKKLTRSNKIRITKLYNKFKFNFQYFITNFQPFRLRYKNLTKKEINNIDDDIITALEYEISDFINTKRQYSAEFYIIAVTFYYNPDIDENDIIPVFQGFNSMDNMLNSIEKIDNQTLTMGKSNLIGGIVQTKNMTMVNFNNITELQYKAMELML